MLGAYERGERAISVPRLERLAQFYTVPVDQLLPREVTGSQADGGAAVAGTRSWPIDLAKLAAAARVARSRC